ncbi:hypothetical protein [Neorhizobium sp. JUb45]|uniref:hypothetical protein n=1 Tax=unclassified Neorhizobium TaxID=2629175 RepID=UPI00104C2509|nr:hypothetical protein [Neorhizobium sp. JUb45]TCR06342.1 hypothetical protein EDF70_101295 [Neorhizobium sp. JUb45]
MQAAKLAAQTTKQQSKAPQGFREINLNVNPVLSGCGPGATATGLTFDGSSADDSYLNSQFQCGGKYSLKGSHYEGVAGITDDGTTIFAVNSRINGAYRTMMGAFDIDGKPKAPSTAQQKILAGLLKNSERRLMPDAKSSGVLGAKTNGTNPRAGVYVGDKKIVYDFGFRVADDPAANNPNKYIDVSASVESDFNHRVTKQSYDIKGRNGAFTGFVGMDRNGNGSQMGYRAGAGYGDFSASARHANNSGAKTSELDLAWNINKDMTLTASWRPDNRPPTSLPASTLKNPGAFQDFSNYSLKLEIKL